jgi:hypothetical protein
MDGTKPYKLIRFGAMDVTQPYKFIRFGAMDVTKTSKVICFGGCHQNFINLHALVPWMAPNLIN